MQTFTSKDEEWRQIDGFPYYEVSSLGRVRSVDRYITTSAGYKAFKKGKILKIYENKKRKSYMYIDISDEHSQKKQFLVHRLVAMAFIPNPENKPHINHIDCNVKNNSVDNLEWVTAQENVDWMIKCGRRRIANERPIVATNITTGEKTIFKSVMEAYRNGYDRPTIRKAIKGTLCQYRGCIWEYISDSDADK